MDKEPIREEKLIMIIPPYTLSLAVLFFYLVEHTKFVEQNTVIVCVKNDGGLKFIFSSRNFTILGKNIIFIPPMINTYFLASNFIANGTIKKSTNHFLKFFYEIMNNVEIIQFLEQSYLYIFAVIFPILVILFGLGKSISIVLGLHIAFYLMMVSSIIFQNPNSMPSGHSKLGLSLELLISPGLMLSVSKRLCSGYTISDFDCVQSLIGSLNLSERQSVVSKIRDRLDDYVQNGEMTSIHRAAYLESIESST